MEYKIEISVSPEEYNELRNSVGWDSKDTSLVLNALNNCAIVRKISIDGKTIGMARAIGDGIYYLIVDVIVIPKHQGKGMGKVLISEITKEIENRTKEGQKAYINLVSMKDKEKFYENCGFKKIPFDYTGYGMTKIIEK